MVKSSFFKNLFTYLPIKIAPAMVGIFLIVFLFRNMNSSEYAKYSLVLTCSLIAAQLSSGWICNSFIYHFDPKTSNSSLFSNSLILALAAGMLASGAAVIALSIIIPRQIIWLAWPLCFFQATFSFLSACAQASFLVREQLVAVILQVGGQAALLLLLFNWAGPNLNNAVSATIAGYMFGSAILLIAASRRLGFAQPFFRISNLFEVLVKSFAYSANLIPWSLGMLLSISADKFALAFFEFPDSGSYLSLKDLLTGASGLISMPLLMLVHPLLFRYFKEKRFAFELIEESVRLMFLVFSLFWGVVTCIAIPVLEQLTEKSLRLPYTVIFIIYTGIVLNAISIYVQKRLEAHKRIGALASLSMGTALVSLMGAFAGGTSRMPVYVALGALLGPATYFIWLMRSVRRKISLKRSIIIPVSIGGSISLLLYVAQVMSQPALLPVHWITKTVILAAAYGGISLFVLWKSIFWQNFYQVH